MHQVGERDVNDAAAAAAGGARRRRSSVGARLAAFATPFSQGTSSCPACGKDLHYRALSRCTHLRCGENDVTEDGLLALAAAISTGGMPLLKELSIGRLAIELSDKHKLVRACHVKRCICLNGKYPAGASSDAWF